MTITENRAVDCPSGSSDAPLQARALLLDGSSVSGARELPAVLS